MNLTHDAANGFHFSYLSFFSISGRAADSAGCDILGIKTYSETSFSCLKMHYVTPTLRISTVKRMVAKQWLKWYLAAEGGGALQGWPRVEQVQGSLHSKELD